MEEPEKSMALKRAYAEIILNTAKEAAARVMVSEKKSLRFQQDLSSTKDEALRLLVRLKQMIDAKTMEAERTSVSQQRKIDELEAQLNEAEDIITDLRAELSHVQDKLEDVRKNQLQCLNVQMTAEDAVSRKDLMPLPASLSPLNSGDVPILESQFEPNSEMATMVMRSKEPEFYRNGCTQRIRALERNLPDERPPPAEVVQEQDPEPLLKTESSMETVAEHEERSIISSPKTKNSMIVNLSREVVKKPTKKRSLRRKKTRFTRTKSTSRRFCAGQNMKPSQSSSILSHFSRYPRSKKVYSDECLQTQSSNKVDNVSVPKGLRESEELPRKRICFDDDRFFFLKRKRTMKAKSRDGLLAETGSEGSASLVTVDVTYGDDQLRHAENEAKIKPLARLDQGFTLIKCGRDSISGSENITSVKPLGKCSFVQNVAVKSMKQVDESMLATVEGDAKVIPTLPSSELSSEMVSIPLTYPDFDKGTKLRDESVLATKEGDNAKVISTVPSSELSSEMVNAPLKCSESGKAKASEEASANKVFNNMPYKYTFQRKRKKASLSESEGKPSAEDSSLKRRAGPEQNDAEEMDKPCSMTEMSRDSRRMAQVARQLISLSGKRWP